MDINDKYHKLVTDNERQLNLEDVAGLPIGHVPRGLGFCFRKPDLREKVREKVTEKRK